MDNTGKKKSRAVVGLGNLLLSDEGFGIHLIRRLSAESKGGQRPELQGVHIEDGGTAGLGLLDTFSRHGEILVVDVIAMDAPAGTIFTFSQDAFQRHTASLRTSPHQIGISDLMALLKLEGKAPRVDFLCVVPERTSPGTDLSPALEKVMERAFGAVCYWARHGRMPASKKIMEGL